MTTNENERHDSEQKRRELMGPADGQQKMRLLADFHANATPIPADDRRDSECGCAPLEYGDGPDTSDCREHGQSPADDRRERYATAIARDTFGRPDDDAVICAADAAMAVADAEQEEGSVARRELIKQQKAYIASADSENARLQEKIRDLMADRARLRSELDSERHKGNAWRAAGENRGATIERVRAVLDNPYHLDGPAVAEIRAALEGEQR